MSIPCESYEKFKDGGCLTDKYLNQAGLMGMYVTNAPSTMKHFLLTHGNETEGLCAGKQVQLVH